MERDTFFADILLPLPLKGAFTYRVPYQMNTDIQFGIRVVVPFGKNKLYSGIIVKIHQTVPQQVNIKYILDIIDTGPVISEKQFALWQWISKYYMCTLGEVMAAALPSALKLAGESQIMLHPNFEGDISELTETEIQIVEHVAHHHKVTICELEKTLHLVKSMPIIKSLVEKQMIVTAEEIRDPYKAKKVTYISLAPPYNGDEEQFYQLLDRLEQTPKTVKQSEVILAMLFLLQQNEGKIDLTKAVKKNDLLDHKKVSPSSLTTLIQNGVLVSKDVIISRLIEYEAQAEAAKIALSEAQHKAFQEIQTQMLEHQAVLLHGVTGSGKTEIYIKLIDKVLAEGKQVLYLLPEIALTSQIVNRLRMYFGDQVGVYHSRFNEYERVEIWNRVLHHSETNQYRLILGARSALLLPYQQLGLIIVDEEHDSSYKQMDPAPRYHARDSAVALGKIHHANILLGTATPSLETYYNVKQNRYGLVELNQRYAQGMMPEIWIANMLESTRQKKVNGIFSQFLLDNIADALEKNEQIILFQNRRGFSLRMFCNSCQSMPTCKYCDVTLTYHKKSNLLKCHYCGYAIDVPKECPNCHSADVEMKGFGTEKVEDNLAELFPKAVIQRMDLDTTRSKTAYQKIITDFEQHKTDILVGTQMVTKGLDFDRVSIVGVLNADNLLSYPDFRSYERAFQTMSQVSGRAGRKEVPGKVIIQSFQPKHPALKFVDSNDFQGMYASQLEERKQFLFPPICRLINLTVKHKDEALLSEAALKLAVLLSELFPKKIMGPNFPIVSRIKAFYMKDIWIKIKKNENLEHNKEILDNLLSEFRTTSKYKSVFIIVNVDA